jgi:hypothetical protein
MKTYKQYYNSLERKLKNFVPESRNRDGAKAVITGSGLFPSWQFTGNANLEEILEWCENHLGDNFIWNWETIYFKTEKDQVLFLLKWS